MHRAPAEGGQHGVGSKADMTEFLRQLWEPIAKLPRTQQIMLAGIVILVFAGIITATMWGSQKDFTPLFEE